MLLGAFLCPGSVADTLGLHYYCTANDDDDDGCGGGGGAINYSVFLQLLHMHLCSCCTAASTNQESHGILEDHFPGLVSHEKQQRSWKVLENDDNVMEFLQLH